MWAFRVRYPVNHGPAARVLLARSTGECGADMDSRDGLSRWTVLIIADACAAYWLWRAGVLSMMLAAILAAVAAVVILAARGAVRSRARKRQELNERLASAMRQVAQR